MVAYAPADEEQGRKTVHMHIQVWVENIDQKLCADLYHENLDKRQIARDKFTQYINKVMTSSFGPDLVYPTSSLQSTTLELTDVPPQTLRDARHKELSKNIKGEVIQMGGKSISAEVLIEWSLSAWQKYTLKDVKDNAVRSDTFFPMSEARKDIAAYTYSYHMPGGSNKETDPFWKNKNIRRLLLTHRFDHHE